GTSPSEDGRGINISGVDFWHAVEFSRNGRFLWAFFKVLRALPFGVSKPYQAFSVSLTIHPADMQRFRPVRISA
ncbi:hypothetical protein ABZY19_24730, partial [Streptomyces sp. NPDC006475]|uniref:hypothetical protein n=1 Tax=Streptomyces sp. NPDC006475 TaxID=3155719 RepID=UPI00339DAD33